MTTLRRISLLIVLGALAACGGKQLDTTIPVDDARLLNSEISAVYVRTSRLLESTAAEVDAIGVFPEDVDADDLDTDLLRHVLEACFTETVRHARDADLEAVPAAAETDIGPEHAILTGRTSVGRLAACSPSRMLALESYLPVVDEAASGFVIDRVLTVDTIRANLKDVLVAQFDDVARTAASVTNDVANLRELAAERRAIAQTGNLSEDERRQNEVDYESITVELDRVDEILGQVGADLGEWRRLRRELVDVAAANIAAMGTD